jgi:hypothetical protein
VATDQYSCTADIADAARGAEEFPPALRATDGDETDASETVHGDETTGQGGRNATRRSSARD